MSINWNSSDRGFFSVNSVGKWVTDLFDICFENKASLVWKALTIVYIYCANWFFPCSFPFSSFMYVSMSTGRAKLQGQSVSLSSGKLSALSSSSKNEIISCLSSHTRWHTFPKLTSRHWSDRASPGYQASVSSRNLINWRCWSPLAQIKSTRYTTGFNTWSSCNKDLHGASWWIM